MGSTDDRAAELGVYGELTVPDTYVMLQRGLSQGYTCEEGTKYLDDGEA